MFPKRNGRDKALPSREKHKMAPFQDWLGRFFGFALLDNLRRDRNADIANVQTIWAGNVFPNLTLVPTAKAAMHQNLRRVEETPAPELHIY